VEVVTVLGNVMRKNVFFIKNHTYLELIYDACWIAIGVMLQSFKILIPDISYCLAPTLHPHL